MDSIYCYDPTAVDPLSKVRGVGRYLQILKECFKKDWIFTDDLRLPAQAGIAADSIFINPFFNFLKYPLTMGRIAKKQIAVIHDLIPLKYPDHFPAGIKGKLNIFLNKLALKNYNLIVTDSEASKSDIVTMFKVDENRVKVVYPTLPNVFTKNTQIAQKKTDIADSAKSVLQSVGSASFALYVGDATWNKNLVNLAKAIKILNVICVFVGKVFEETPKNANKEHGKTQNDSWQKELKEFYVETKNDKRFIFLGYVPDDKLIQLYQQARCNILISRDEGFGFSYLEAASQDCPSVLSDIQVLHETSKNQGALFANPNDANDIANAIGEVYFNKDLRDRLGAEAEKRAEYFSHKKFVANFLKILNLNN